MTEELVNHIEQNQTITEPLIVLIKISKCCSIDDEGQTTKNLESFQKKYPSTCGIITLSNAKSCVPFIRSQRNFTIFLSCIAMIFRLLALLLLWKYIKDEYHDNNNETMDYSTTDGKRSTANFIAQ
ncbi:unnamed protein product [Adineta steineri]|uniref:Uncharacterized protein n=1 Tax=Adineta steineri TaxID=433720 RepID=A0A818RHD2_9BILA|nr:unnamed protein product [Adineta steineri]CAF0910786.1 unnamed protein product [Adineta steineri]CAF0950191.1 unnamed protein product [Adineta steineri]CAF3657082.1 unnamed protein product [Adineta steineri]CAF3837790.1 unnamed protein product [Adineta steineri]